MRRAVSPVERMAVGVQVGGQRKILPVTGDRRCSYREGAAPVFTDPEPFTEMEIRYDRAYGGRDEKSMPDIPFMYPRNFMGVGVVLRNVKEAVEGLPLPNIEDPQDLLTPERLFIEEPDRWHLQPLPQGFGWRQRTWYPRCGACSAPIRRFSIRAPSQRKSGWDCCRRTMWRWRSSRGCGRMEAQFANGASFGMIFAEPQGRRTGRARPADAGRPAEVLAARRHAIDRAGSRSGHAAARAAAAHREHPARRSASSI